MKFKTKFLPLLIILLNLSLLSNIVNADNLDSDISKIDKQLTDINQEQRAQKIFRQIRCLTCKGQVVESSNSDFATNIRVFVRQKIISGDSDEQIFNSLQETFGREILQNRKIDRYNALFWFSIFAFSATALSIIAGYYRSQSKASL